MNDENKEELSKLNIKIDHITKIVCELFIMCKSNERFDDKLDQCIKSLNNLNSRVNNMSITNIPNIPLSPPPLPTIKKSSNNSTVVNSISSRDQLMEELKKKLTERQSSIKIE